MTISNTPTRHDITNYQWWLSDTPDSKVDARTAYYELHSRIRFEELPIATQHKLIVELS